MITSIRNQTIIGAKGRPLVYDVILPHKQHAAPVILFCHGYKGFKDWGAWGLMASTLAHAGVACVTFNYSHNGGTVEQPIDFPDLEAFGNNNYTLEIQDTKRMLDWIVQATGSFDASSIYIMGHSRAGGISTLVAASDSRIKGLITLAGVSNFAARFPTGKALAAWQEQGVLFITNGRTKQQMPLYYQFYEDFAKHKDTLNILKAAAQLTIPHLIIHGDADPTVDVQEAFALSHCNAHSELFVIAGANHVFGAAHPWNKPFLPEHMQRAMQCAVNFVQNTSYKSIKTR